MSIKFLVIVSLAAILASCSTDDCNLSPVDPSAPACIPISLNVGVSGSASSSASRSGYSNSNLPQDFMLFIKQDHDKDYSTDPAVNCNYNYGSVHIVNRNGVWTPDNVGDLVLYWKYLKPAATVTTISNGYFQERYNMKFEGGSLVTITIPAIKYPQDFGEDLQNEIGVGVLSDQTTLENVRKSDFLYMGQKNVNPGANGELQIRFRHMFSKLRVVLERGVSIDGNTEFKSVRFENCPTTSYLTDGQISISAYPGIFQSSYDHFVSMLRIDGEDSLIWECIMAPHHNFHKDAAIIIEATDGRLFKYRIDNEIKFESGKLYTLTLTVEAGVRNSRVSSLSFTSESWNDEVLPVSPKDLS